MYPPGLRLRQIRENAGLTYRDVEKASYEIAVKRGRPDFILHISRLADIENRNVVPSLHKLYSLAAILHLDPLEISGWYEAPFQQTLPDGASFPPPVHTWAKLCCLARHPVPSAQVSSCRLRNFCKAAPRALPFPGRASKILPPEDFVTAISASPTGVWCLFCVPAAPC